MRLIDDARFGLRMMRQRPLFALVATISIAIGVGATTTIFSVFNALLFRTPPGVAQPERVVELGRTNGGRGFDTFGYPELRAMQEQSKLLLQWPAGASRRSALPKPAAASASWAWPRRAPTSRSSVCAPRSAVSSPPNEDRVPGANPVTVLELSVLAGSLQRRSRDSGPHHRH